jgi:hypothetical protein
MFSSVTNAIAALLNIAASILWGAVSGIVGTNLGIAVLVILALIALFLLFRLGARKRRPNQDGPR